MEEQYGSAWDGFAQTSTDRAERNAARVDAAEALFRGITNRFGLGEKRPFTRTPLACYSKICTTTRTVLRCSLA
ncbi:hypothetical protein P8A22_35860 [Streptomyces laculatispora]|uniref:Uncharacterized protein n=1 Tax=Streptomyces laculatispora TaxID=887464 RepID=A0ABY9IEJ2_9ACTN|nr:hypothetical protein [Streptomyces laculatispora]WLQ44801.1 hypothetical protein P8A22_35860 [Streptomyces laculatispora]